VRRGGSGDFHLGPAHAFQNRHFAVVVDVDTDAEIDFGGIGIRHECFGYAQDGVAGRHFDGGKQGCGHG